MKIISGKWKQIADDHLYKNLACEVSHPFESTGKQLHVLYFHIDLF